MCCIAVVAYNIGRRDLLVVLLVTMSACSPIAVSSSCDCCTAVLQCKPSTQYMSAYKRMQQNRKTMQAIVQETTPAASQQEYSERQCAANISNMLPVRPETTSIKVRSKAILQGACASKMMQGNASGSSTSIEPSLQ